VGGDIGDPRVSSAVSAILLVVKYILSDNLTCFHILSMGNAALTECEHSQACFEGAGVGSLQEEFSYRNGDLTCVFELSARSLTAFARHAVEYAQAYKESRH
jgi:hypothetical protein